MKYVILGNGVAGIHAAETIRRMDPDASIVMIADETFEPYCRPMISLVLEGAVPHEKLPIRGARYYEEWGIEPVLGDRASAVDVDSKAVVVGEDRAVDFDKLLIATGADPRPIKATNRNLDNIFFMRTEAHVRRMLEALPDARRALVLGGGLVGFKAAYGLLHRGLRVTMLIGSEYPLSMQADETTGMMILDELKARGLEVRVGVEVASFEGVDEVKGAHLSDGTELPCDMVVIGKGVLPALSFVPRDRIQVDLGILVDEHMQTTSPDIYAAGDVAEYIDVARDARWVNAIWPEAVSQGRIAGFNMAGRPVSYNGSLSRNVIRIFGLDVMTGGLVNPPADPEYEVLSMVDPRRKLYRKLVFRGDHLTGMAMVNGIDQGGLLISLMHSQAPVRIPKRKMLDPSFNYRQLLP